MENGAIREPYASYEYYSNEYKGRELDKTAFDKNVRWATALADEITFGRVRKLKEIPDCVKDAVCCATEKYSAYQNLRNQKLVSEDNDDYRVTYAAAGKQEELRAEIITDIKMYLSGTGLTYRGRSRRYDNESGYHHF